MNFKFKFVIKSRHILNKYLIGGGKNFSGLTDGLFRKKKSELSLTSVYIRGFTFVSNFLNFACYDTFSRRDFPCGINLSSIHLFRKQFPGFSIDWRGGFYLLN